MPFSSLKIEFEIRKINVNENWFLNHYKVISRYFKKSFKKQKSL
ncbi:hypothetical protein C8P67_101353 [Flavobacterium aquicola]|uniref:Uncharacterized protein n=1 Tax=Flavobacterium aquicola TaxID=1682742 RepID=A0A3E0EUQ6_9FLAO|nr:hypothetical protein C8P67_101353 [Flavobacterium aquicola]